MIASTTGRRAKQLYHPCKTGTINILGCLGAARNHIFSTGVSFLLRILRVGKRHLSALSIIMSRTSTTTLRNRKQHAGSGNSSASCTREGQVCPQIVAHRNIYFKERWRFEKTSRLSYLICPRRTTLSMFVFQLKQLKMRKHEAAKLWLSLEPARILSGHNCGGRDENIPMLQ